MNSHPSSLQMFFQMLSCAYSFSLLLRRGKNPRRASVEMGTPEEGRGSRHVHLVI